MAQGVDRIPDLDIKTAAQTALQANKDHQYALKVYTERLEAELDMVDKLIASVEGAEEPEDEEFNAHGIIKVPGAVKPVSIIHQNALLSEDSPFNADAEWRKRYVYYTTINPMKAREYDALSEAVLTETYHMHAFGRDRHLVQLDDIRRRQHQSLETSKQGIDWERVAKKVTSFSHTGVKRPAKEYEISWLGDRHPEFNHSTWTVGERDRLKKLTSDHSNGPIDWTVIAEKLGTHRTPIDCMRHGLLRRTHVWDPESDRKLLHAVELYGNFNWNLVARFVSEDATSHQCQKRFFDTLDPNIKRGAWTTDEDERLRLAVEAFGSSWDEISHFVPGRTRNQCRERYQDRLNPTAAKGKWSCDEDTALLAAVAALGDSAWGEVCLQVGTGRTDNMCRRRYDTLQKKEQNMARPGQASQSSSVAGPSSSQDTLTSSSTPVTASSRSVPKRICKKKQPSGVRAPGATSSETQPKPTKPRPRPRMRNAGTAAPTQQPEASSEGLTSTTSDLPTQQNTNNSAQTTSLEGSGSQAINETAASPSRLLIKIPKRAVPDDSQEASTPKKRLRAKVNK